MRSVMQNGPLVLGLVLAATISGGCKHLPDVPPGPKTRELRLQEPYGIVIEAQPISGMHGAHYSTKAASGADFSRVEFYVGVNDKMPPYVIRLSQEQLLALDRQLQREEPTLVDLQFVDAPLYTTLANMVKEAEEADEDDVSIHVKTVLYYSFYFGKKVRESVDEGEMEVQH